MSLRDQLSPCVRLRFPGFEKQYHFEERASLRGSDAYYFEPVDCRNWYRRIADRILQSVDGGTYLPLYRMGDGEYLFALRENPEGQVPFWGLSFSDKVRRLVRRLRGEAQRGSGGVYTVSERKETYSKFVEGLRMVAEEGILGLGLHEGQIYNRYIPEIFDWFDEHQIEIRRSNYIHVYAIYALMNGPDVTRLLGGRRVLVITGLDNERASNIRKGLKKKGVENVQFLPVSNRRSMLDTIQVSAVEKPVDLVLIAAGIGTINVLQQLRGLRVPQLDIGFCLDTIADPKLRWKRPFCVPDKEYDVERVEYVSDEVKKRAME